jgi:hypothetical protein
MPLSATLRTGTDPRLPSRAIRNQAQWDACIPCAIAAVLEGRGLHIPELSPTFLMHYAFGRGAALGGLTIDQARVLMNVRGISEQRFYQHDVSAGTPPAEPNEHVVRNGARRRTLSDWDGRPWFELVTGPSRESAWVRELNQGHPVLARIWQNPGYDALRDAGRHAFWRDPRAIGPSHAVAILGLDSAERMFIVQDSQGVEFGDRGDWYMPFAQSESVAVLDAYALRIPLRNLEAEP